MDKKDILKIIRNSIESGKPVIGVAAGSGFLAKQAIEGGADFILVLNAGKFRNAGVSSLACMMPFANSNDLVFEIGEKEILTKKLKKPVIFGACASDLTINQDKLLDKIEKSGFNGINNFPTVGLVDGQYREFLEENSMGFYTEVELMKKAVKRGMFTIAFVFNEKQSIDMTKVGVDVICAHLGWTLGGESNVKNKRSIEEDINIVNKIFKAANSINKNVFKMVYGGIINNPDTAVNFYDNTEAIGYIGGSSFERIPSEAVIRSVTNEFKNYYVLKNENKRLKNTLLKKRAFNEIIGQSTSMQEIYDLIDKVASKDVNVLVQGESGTGKELIVKSLHYNSNRYDKPFIKINCAAMPKEILESELFGHEKGAFTGADKRRIGRFELADKGTLFLDEIGDMDLSIQAKFLRIIQQQEFERVGGNETIKVDVRIICATNKNLREAVKKGEFREDLYYRLNTITLYVPPLKDRKEDIPILIHHFLKIKSEKFGKAIPKITPIAFDAMLNYNWPGNIRELEHAIERAVILEENNLIDIENLPVSISEVFKDENTTKHKNYFEMASSTIGTVEKQIIIDTLTKNNWNRTLTAKDLGITRRTLYNKIKKYEIERS